MNLFVGHQGENSASNFLKQNGFEILQRNVRSKTGEIDIVAKRSDTIFFIEVKTRNGDKYGKPYEAITSAKQRHMKRAATWYVLQNKLEKSKLKLAVVSILIENEKEDIRMYEFD